MLDQVVTPKDRFSPVMAQMIISFNLYKKLMCIPEKTFKNY